MLIEEENLSETKEPSNGVVNNQKTKEISKEFQSTEDMINKSTEIENKITSTELINFYFNALESSNQLLEKNKITEKNFEKIQKTIEEFSQEVTKLTKVTEVQKERNEDRKTIEAYKDSWDNMNIFIKTMLNKLNAVTISTNNNSNSKNTKTEIKKESSIFTYVVISSVSALILIILLKKIFF